MQGEKAKVGPFALNDCVCVDGEHGQFHLALIDTEYRFKASSGASAQRVANAVRGCQYSEMIGWKPVDLCRWLEISAVPTRSLGCLDQHNVPGMHFAKLGARHDMKGKVQEELEALTGLSPDAVLEVIRPLLSLQDQEVYDWLEETDRTEKGRRTEIHEALHTWRQLRDIENAKQ